MIFNNLEKYVEAKPFDPIWSAIYKKLSDDITTLGIQPGTYLSEAQCAKAMGVSRTPVKMALDRLVLEGVVEKVGGKGYRVANLSMQDCLDLCEARLGLEGQAAYLAAKRMSTAQLDQMQQWLAVLRKVDESGDYKNYPAADQEFHQIIVDAANNEHISRMYDCINMKMLRYRHYIVTVNFKFEHLFVHHESIFRALRSRYSEIARSEISRDIECMRLMAGYIPALMVRKRD